MRIDKFWRLVCAAAVGSLALAAGLYMPAAAQEQPTRILFMHHSTGGGFIGEGGLRDRLTALGYELWDHGYNDEGLTNNLGEPAGENWAVPDDNTDPDGWSDIFGQPVTDPPANTFSHMLTFDVILFKSCFPSSDIDSQERLDDYRRYYLAIRDVTDQHPDKLFIAFTTPPLVPGATTPENAARAQRWADTLTSPEYLDGHANLAVFDVFSTLADDDGMLRAEYRGPDPTDSHPNAAANEAAGAALSAFVDEAIRSFEAGEPLPVAAVDVPPEVEATEAPETEPAVETEQEPVEDSAPIDAGELRQVEQIGSFEDGTTDGWWDWSDSARLAWEVIESGHGDSRRAMQFDFNVDAGGSGGIGVNFDADPAWSDVAGISFFWRADPPGLPVTFALAVQDPAEPDAGPSDAAPFEVILTTGGQDWQQVTIPWGKFAKAEWFGEAGVDKFDPASVIWLAFSVGSWDQPERGVIWIDDIRLVPRR